MGEDISYDEVDKVVSGTFTSFSVFTIFEAIPSTVDGLQAPLADLAPGELYVTMPSKSFRQGRTLPLKLQLSRDSVALTDANVAPPTIVDVALVGGPLGSPVLDLDSGASSDDDYTFRFADGIWIYNLGTRDLTEAGVYFVTVEMPDSFRYRAGFELK